MARIKLVEINNFRGIKSMTWAPGLGMNCLVGPGDSGKSTILDAMDLCLGARRSVQFSDADFHLAETGQPIGIAVTVGDLSAGMRSMDAYGQFLRGWDPALEMVEDEPGAGLETVITACLAVHADLEPAWSLYSERAVATGATRALNWTDRVAIAPLRIGGSASVNLGWRRGSVLDRLSDERTDATAALVAAAREARRSFGTDADEQLKGVLAIVAEVAVRAGVPLEGGAHAYLDAASVSFSGGTVSLHDGRGVPLGGLGTGSSRLMVAGLQRKAADRAGIVLVDELEHGLEPHRIIGLLGSLGAKDDDPATQVFATTHSPAAVRELAAKQLFVVRGSGGAISVIPVAGYADEVQGTMRLHPEALLAHSVIVCEGATEVGLIRGLGRWRAESGGAVPITARGVALVDAGGVSKIYDKATAFQALGYTVMALRDDDAPPDPKAEEKFKARGGKVIYWRQGRATEQELFEALPGDAVSAMIDTAAGLHGEAAVRAHVASTQEGASAKADPRGMLDAGGRLRLGKAAKKSGWYKTVGWMDEVGADIVGPNLIRCDAAFQATVAEIFGWIG